jgi:O-antigen ligase
MQQSRDRNGTFIDAFAQFYIVFVALSYNIEIVSKLILFLIGMVLLTLLVVKRAIDNRSFNVYKIDVWWLFFILIFIFNRDPKYADFATYFLLLGLFAMFVFRDNTNGFKGLFCAIFLFTSINLIFNVISIFSPSLFDNLTNFLKISKYIDDYSSLTGLFSDIGRNAYAAITGFSVAFALLFGKYKKHKLILWMFAISMVIIVILTGKLGHSFFLIASILLLYTYLEKSLVTRLRNVTLITVLLFFVIGGLAILFPEAGSVVNRTIAKLTSGDVSSGRFNVWKISLDLFFEKPFFGIGYGGFTVNSLDYTGIATYAGVHNDYIQWLTETGITGFIVNSVILISTYSVSIKMYSNLNKIIARYTFVKSIILWSIFFQTFVILYSFSGTPHFSYEINTLYLLACAVPFSVMANLKYYDFENNLLFRIRLINS